MCQHLFSFLLTIIRFATYLSTYLALSTYHTIQHTLVPRPPPKPVRKMKSVLALATSALLVTSPAAAFSGASSFGGAQLSTTGVSNQAGMTMEYIPRYVLVKICLV